MSAEYNIVNGPANVPVTFVQGDEFGQPVLIYEDDVLVDIDSDEFTLVVKGPRGDVLATLTVGGGIENTATGEITWTLTEAQTTSLPTNCDLKYSLRWDTRKVTIVTGKMTVIAI